MKTLTTTQELAAFCDLARTSVSLEEEFWRAFREIAEEKSLAINALATEIDKNRDLETGLATAIRLYVLAHYRSRP